MRWKWESARSEDGVGQNRSTRSKRIRVDLERRGVDAEFARSICSALAERLAGADAQAYDSLLDGVAVACGIHTGTRDELTKTARDLQEIERLMGAFAGELSKLDEVLEVLAAHVRRMRTNAPRRETRLLH